MAEQFTESQLISGTQFEDGSMVLDIGDVRLALNRHDRMLLLRLLADPSPAPAPDPRGPLSIVDTLRLAEREFVFHAGCIATDRPDLPLSPETSWTVDFENVRAAIADAIAMLVGADRTASQCEGCSTSQLIQQLSVRTRYSPEQKGSSSPPGGAK